MGKTSIPNPTRAANNAMLAKTVASTFIQLTLEAKICEFKNRDVVTLFSSIARSFVDAVIISSVPKAKYRTLMGIGVGRARTGKWLIRLSIPHNAMKYREAQKVSVCLIVHCSVVTYR